jgi:hypothetical protein
MVVRRRLPNTDSDVVSNGYTATTIRIAQSGTGTSFELAIGVHLPALHAAAFIGSLRLRLYDIATLTGAAR